MPFGAGLQTFFSQQLYFLKSLLSKDVSSGSIAPTNGPHSFRKRALLPCSQEESIELVSMNHEVRSHQTPWTLLPWFPELPGTIFCYLMCLVFDFFAVAVLADWDKSGGLSEVFVGKYDDRSALSEKSRESNSVLPSNALSCHHGIRLSAMLHKQSTKCWASRPVLGKSWLRLTFQGL